MNCHRVTIDVWSFFGWLCWGLGLAVLGVHLSAPEHALGSVAVGLFAAAATLHTRAAIVAHDENARRAFELGREVGREERLPGNTIPLQRTT